MTPEQINKLLDELKKLNSQATPGPWTLEFRDGYITGHIVSPLHNYCGNKSARKDSIAAPDSMTHDDGAFIVACVNYVRKQLAIMSILLALLLSGCAAWRHPKYPLTPVGGVTCKTGILKPFGGPGWHNCVEKQQDVKPPAPYCDGKNSCKCEGEYRYNEYQQRCEPVR